MSELKRVSNSDESTENYLKSVSLSSIESLSTFQLTVLVHSRSFHQLWFQTQQEAAFVKKGPPSAYNK